MLARPITEMSARNLVVITPSVEKRSDCSQWLCDEAGNMIETHEYGGRFQRVVMPCVRRAWRSSRAGVIQPLSGPADLGDHGKPRVSQLRSRCSRAAKYAP